MKTGLFGGTFNPFHNGHIRIIEHVQKAFGLEIVFLIPSASPPHKPDLDLAPARDRYAMVQESIRGNQNLIVSDKEMTRKGPCYTIDTIRLFQQELGNTADLYLLMGSDAFMDITTWKHKDRIFDEVKTVVMLRKPDNEPILLLPFIHEHLSGRYTYHSPDQSFVHPDRQTIFIARVPKIDISSTLIRKRIRQGQSIAELVPAGALRIIQEKELYQ